MNVVDKNVVEKLAARNNLDVFLVENILNTVYTEEELRNMNLLTQLRVVGRIKGVKSPTNKSADQLIKSILAIQEGEADPSFSFRGRKTKNKVQIINTHVLTHSQPPPEKIGVREYCPTDVNPSAKQLDREYPSTNQKLDPTLELVDTPFDNDDSTPDFKVTGILDILPEGFGFIRRTNITFEDANLKNDVFVSSQQIKRFNLRQGDKLACTARFFNKGKAPSIIFVHEINDQSCDKIGKRINFAESVATYPTERIMLSAGEDNDESLRLIDLISPIGKGQRGLIVAPPKTGTTTLLKKIAKTVAKNYGDEIKVFMLLVAERPEEVTDIKSDLTGIEVAYSTFDQTPAYHALVIENVLNNSKRRVEQGQDVLILMDSLTRFVRSCNQDADSSMKIMTGGFDLSALEIPKAFFASARSVVNGGSLTIIASAIVDTGSRIDDVIYEEFKGTSNMEIHLDRELADMRVFPAINCHKSGTLKEEKLYTPKELQCMTMLRRSLATIDKKDATLQLLDVLSTTKNNEEFLDDLQSKKRSFAQLKKH